VFRRPLLYVAAIVVGVIAAAVGLPWWVALLIAVAACIGGAALASGLFAWAARAPRHAEQPVATEVAVEDGLFRLDGDYWSVALHGPPVRLADKKGLHYIHRLLETPWIEVWAADLEGLGQTPSVAVGGIEDDLHRVGGDSHSVVDQKALRQYKLRVEDLREQIEEAEHNNDAERAARAREELEILAAEIARVTRPQGSTTFPGEAERARVNVTRAIRSAIAKIREHDASLGHHLDHDIRTGNYCAYEPDPSGAPHWIL
jgi:hypothetical protein